MGSVVRHGLVVQALNEAACIQETVTYLKQHLAEPPLEVIVVDGGSSDRCGFEPRILSIVGLILFFPHA